MKTINTQIQDVQHKTRSIKKTTQRHIIIKIFNKAKIKGKP